MTDPPGWQRVRLDEIAEVQGGIQKQPKRRPTDNRYPFLRVTNVLRGSLDLEDLHEVQLFTGELERFALRPGDLLVVEGNGSPNHIGRAALWGGEIADCVHQNHLIRVRPGPTVSPQFLELAWNSPAIIDQLHTMASSTSGLFTLSTAKLKSVHIPLPPLGEQQRIVDFLHSRLKSIDLALQVLSTTARRLTALHEALVNEILASNTQSVPLSSLLVERIINGRSVPTRTGGFPVLRLTSVRRGQIDLSQRKDGDWSAIEAQPFIVRDGDFLVIRGNGSLSLVGRGGLVSKPSDLVAFPDTLIRLRVDMKLVDPKLFAAIWNSNVVHSQLEAQARTTAGIYKINQRMINNLSIPLPRREKHGQILARFEEGTAIMNTLEAAAKSALMRGRALRASLMRHAFAGHLLPNAPQGAIPTNRADRVASRRRLTSERLDGGTVQAVTPKSATREVAQ